MTLIDWLLTNMQRLANAGVDSPRRDCMVLVEDLLTKDRAWVNAHPEFKLTKEQVRTLDKQISRRENREPLAYIRGKAWFYGRFFEVNQSVMVPRPESETIVDIVKSLRPSTIVDLGTGSGCLAITSELELPKTKVIAIDNDQKALQIALYNAVNHQTKAIDFLHGNMLEPLKEVSSYTLLANLPYVPLAHSVSKEIGFEPKHAIYSGSDGLDHYKKFWQQVGAVKSHPKYIITESLKSQHKAVAMLALESGYKLQKTELLSQLFIRD